MITARDLWNRRNHRVAARRIKCAMRNYQLALSNIELSERAHQQQRQESGARIPNTYGYY